MNFEKTSDVGETFEWTVRSYECAPDGKVTVANVCNYLQEAASINAEHLGFSKTNFDEDQLNVTWVMTRMRVRLTRRPKWNEVVKVFTFPRPARRIVAWRDFILSDAEGVEIGRASTEWMMIDMISRRPVAIPAFVTERANTVRPSVFSEPLGFKIDFSTLTPTAEPYAIRAAASDIDLNGHVNNVRYITWLFDAVDCQPEAIDLEIAFKGEVLKGAEVTVETVAEKDEIFQRIKSSVDHVLAKLKIARLAAILSFALSALLAGCAYDGFDGDWAYVSKDKDLIVSAPDWDQPTTINDVEYYPLRYARRGFFSYQEPVVVYGKITDWGSSGNFVLESSDGSFTLTDVSFQHKAECVHPITVTLGTGDDREVIPVKTLR